MTQADDTMELTEQDLLKVFDYEITAEAPVLTVDEIADALAEHFGIEVSNKVIQCRLGEMESNNKVVRKTFSTRLEGWTALVAPKLSDSVTADVEATEGELEQGETVSHDELFGSE